MPNADMGELLARLVRQCVHQGESVRLDGVGTFDPAEGEALRFIAETAPSVFIAYVSEDAVLAMRLYDELQAGGLRPWIDKRRLLPGQNWPRAIERAIERADFFIPCFSATSVRKRGQFPRELRLGMRAADKMPLDDTFVIPVRLDRCDMPRQLQSSLHKVDLFADWNGGVTRLVETMWSEFGQRMSRY